MEEFSFEGLGPEVVEEFDSLFFGQDDAEGESLRQTEAGMGPEKGDPQYPLPNQISGASQFEPEDPYHLPTCFADNEHHGYHMEQFPTYHLPEIWSNSLVPYIHLDGSITQSPAKSIEYFVSDDCGDKCYIEAKSHDSYDGFQFESKAVVLEDRRPKPKPKPKRKEPFAESLRCEVLGCRYRGTFTRKYELQRHMKKHTKDQSFDCPILGCNRKGLHSYYRSDKLRLHLKNNHTDDEECPCPHPGCQSGSTSLLLMQLHIRNHETKGLMEDIILGESRFFYPQFSCPLPNCRSRETANTFPTHLRSHNPAELREHASRIHDFGLDAVTGKIFCPVCPKGAGKQQLFEAKEFEEHVLLSHLISDEKHFVQFRDQTKYRGTMYGGSITPWYSEGKTYSLKPLVCTFCDKTASGDYRSEVDHHLALLKDLHEIYPFRRQILRLWPEFGLHPIFEDIMPSVDRDFERRW